MNPADLLWKLATDGIRLRLDGAGALAYEADPGALTAETRQAILGRRAEIVGLLAKGAAGTPASFLPVTAQQAYACRPLSGRLSYRETNPYWETNVVAFHLASPLRRDRLDAAVARVARRHPLLRAQFREMQGRLACGILRPDDGTPPPEFTDARCPAGPSDRAHDEVVIDPARPPLWTVRAVNRGTGSTIVLAMHFAISDGWSMHVLLEELLHFHDGGQEQELPEPGDFGLWARTAAPAPVSTPDAAGRADSGPVTVLTFAASFDRSRIWADARDHRTTPFALLAGAFAAAVAETRKTDRVTVTVPVSQRDDLRFERIVGPLRDNVAIDFVFPAGADKPHAVGRAANLARAALRAGVCEPSHDLRLRFNFLDFSSRAAGEGSRVAGGEILGHRGRFELKLYVWFDPEDRGLLRFVFSRAAYGSADVEEIRAAFERAVSRARAEGGAP